MTEPDLKPDDEARFDTAEYVLYQRSPFGMIGTSALIFVLVYGFYVLIAQLTQRPAFLAFDDAGNWITHPVSWVAFVLSLIQTAAIAFAGSAKGRWETETDDLVLAVNPAGRQAALNLSKGTPVSWRAGYHRLFWAGFVFGIIFNVVMILIEGISPLEYANSVGLWFLIVSPILFGTGFRAGMDVSRRSREIKQLIADHLLVDLFHLDRLNTIGKIGLRAARSWMIMAAILLLFMLNPEQLWITVPTIVATAAGGVFILTSALNPVHRKIVAAKQAELARIHDEMAQVRDRALAGEDAASSALAGLTDYEIWVTNRPEWPLSTGLATRFSLYILLPIIPIVGSYLFEKLADQLVTGGPA
ncbi:hypothetical protein AWH62_06530 [Maricaulis sp. W15]|uniref:Uncharacterized protein n=1 Tax=Maricaulis maris TaxID=74318 RepID=A0A495D4D9_9PROT|nr:MULTISPECIES: hypothetical protein [Maricaulis]OLF75467.1 hypothetical protein AWH62_06530 [Maricaulis sp. W15]RKQ96766.1 hypothetical protein C7435_2100 [Maricaulis maris]